MNLANEAYAEYQASGIWTMNSARSSCVVPERPLLITEDEKRGLDALAKGVWAGFVAIAGYMRESDQLIWNTVRNPARGSVGCFPEGPTMPPAIRIDVVRTSDGPKIVEADPVSARSLGETAFLANIWRRSWLRYPKQPYFAHYRGSKEERCGRNGNKPSQETK